MNYNDLFRLIQRKRSFLCIGLDTDIKLIPSHLLGAEDPVFEFNKQIVDATLAFTVAYKPNLAFYEARGEAGWRSLRKTLEYIRNKDKDVFLIADAKRGDIGNTSGLYAEAFFEHLKVDAVTLSPYMGLDTVAPFLKYKDHWVVLLALTSNQSASDFQLTKDESGLSLFEKVLKVSKTWASPDQLMFVVGATRADELKRVRALVPENFLLVPGVGAQGGSLQEVARYGMNSHCGLLINSSRGIIYASAGVDFAERAAEKAIELQAEMESLLKANHLI